MPYLISRFSDSIDLFKLRLQSDLIFFTPLTILHEKKLLYSRAHYAHVFCYFFFNQYYRTPYSRYDQGI